MLPCSWVSSQQEMTEANLITNLQPSASDDNKEEMVSVRDGQIAFNEAAIQVDSDLFVCPQIKTTKKAEELDVGENSSIEKGNKHKSTPQSINN